MLIASSVATVIGFSAVCVGVMLDMRRGEEELARQTLENLASGIDADHFKTYNDTFGHQAGDQVLVGIVICISDSVSRAGDCTARFGGEEFAVLLPGNTAAHCRSSRWWRERRLSFRDGPKDQTRNLEISMLRITPE